MFAKCSWIHLSIFMLFWLHVLDVRSIDIDLNNVLSESIDLKHVMQFLIDKHNFSKMLIDNNLNDVLSESFDNIHPNDTNDTPIISAGDHVVSVFAARHRQSGVICGAVVRDDKQNRTQPVYRSPGAATAISPPLCTIEWQTDARSGANISASGRRRRPS